MNTPGTEHGVRGTEVYDSVRATCPARPSLFEEAWMQWSCRRVVNRVEQTPPHSVPCTAYPGQSDA
jgi:hypothetical protein